MECIVLAGAAGERTALQWQLEDLGADWRCRSAAQAEQARQMMLEHPAELMVLTACPEAEALLTSLHQQPLLAPPWVLGRDCAAPDGPLPEWAALPLHLQAWKREGRLPALCAARLPEATALARGLLHALGVPERLRAWTFLPDMGGLIAVHPPLLTDMAHSLYPLVAHRHGMTPAAVERSLRLCVESTWSRAPLQTLERFFGSTVDPDRGKPTNREFLFQMQHRITLAAVRLKR